MISALLPSTVPESEIVFGNLGLDHENVTNSDKIDCCKRVGTRLYKKYIANGSEYEINISSLMRDDLTNLMNDENSWLTSININENDLYSMFDASRSEIYKLMYFSFFRMKSSTMAKIQAILQNDKKFNGFNSNAVELDEIVAV